MLFDEIWDFIDVIQINPKIRWGCDPAIVSPVDELICKKMVDYDQILKYVHWSARDMHHITALRGGYFKSSVHATFNDVLETYMRACTSPEHRAEMWKPFPNCPSNGQLAIYYQQDQKQYSYCKFKSVMPFAETSRYYDGLSDPHEFPPWNTTPVHFGRFVLTCAVNGRLNVTLAQEPLITY